MREDDKGLAPLMTVGGRTGHHSGARLQNFFSVLEPTVVGFFIRGPVIANRAGSPICDPITKDRLARSGAASYLHGLNKRVPAWNIGAFQNIIEPRPGVAVVKPKARDYEILLGPGYNATDSQARYCGKERLAQPFVGRGRHHAKSFSNSARSSPLRRSVASASLALIPAASIP